MKQPGFFDLSSQYEGLDAKRDPVLAIAAVVPFELFRTKLKAALVAGGLRTADGDRKSAAGRKPWDEVLIFKVLVLHALYNLSDDQMEYQLRDRLSFMHFVGLGLEDAVPDAKTLWLCREALAKSGRGRGAVQPVRYLSEDAGIPRDGRSEYRCDDCSSAAPAQLAR